MSLIKKAVTDNIDSSMSEVHNQIINNLSEPLTKTTVTPVEQVTVSQPAENTSAAIEKNIEQNPVVTGKESITAKPKSRYSDTLLLNLPVGKRNEIKDFFQQYNLSMTQGILFGLNYLMEDVKSGRIEISKLGIERK